MAEQDAMSSLVAMALALESKVAPAAALALSRALEKLSPSQQAAAIIHAARLGWAFVTEARKEKGGTTASPDLRDAMKAVRGCIAFATSGAPKVQTTTSVVDACKRDEDQPEVSGAIF